jgi:hypothetical protein
MRNIHYVAAGLIATAVATTGLVAAPDARSSESLAAVAVAYRDVTIPAGTPLSITLDSSLASDRNRVEDVVRAHLRRPVVVQGTTVLPAGTPLVGTVTSVRRPGRVKGRGYISFRFHRLDVAESNQRVSLRTSAVGRTSPSGRSRDVKTIAIPAAGGAVVGALAGGKKGAAIGTAAGAGGGTAVALSTRGPEVRVGRGATAVVRLTQPITVRVKR